LALFSLDKETSAPAWAPVHQRPLTSVQTSQTQASPSLQAATLEGQTLLEESDAVKMARKCFLAVCDAFEKNSDFLTALDAAVGDGDLGSNLETASKLLKPELASRSFSHPDKFLSALGYGLQQVRPDTHTHTPCKVPWYDFNLKNTSILEAPLDPCTASSFCAWPVNSAAIQVRKSGSKDSKLVLRE
jgi:hypothetical protein